MRRMIVPLILLVAHSGAVLASDECPPTQKRLNTGEPCIPEPLFNYLYCLSKSGGGKVELSSKNSSGNTKNLEVTLDGKGSGVIIKGEGAVGVRQSEATQAAKELSERLDPTLATKCESLARLVVAGTPNNPSAACSISGRVFGRTTNQPLPGLAIDFYTYKSAAEIRESTLVLKTAGITGPDGTFTANCHTVPRTAFPLRLAVSRVGQNQATEYMPVRVEPGESRTGVNLPTNLDR